MKKRRAPSAKNKLDYPVETNGSRVAAEVRKRANKLTKEEREELFKQAMRVYYGGDWPKETSRS
jgi:hypothetical protein